MADLATAASLAFLVVGIIAVPAASQEVTEPAPVSDSLPAISDSESENREVVTRQTEDSFTKTVTTAFQKFSSEITPESAKTELDKPDSELVIEQTQSGKVWKLTTPKGRLLIRETYSGTEERTETAYGTLVKESNGSESSERFTGKDRQKVEEIASELRVEMRERQEELSNFTEESRKVEFELEVHSSAPEYVDITNKGDRDMDLEGWKIGDKVSNYTLSNQLSEGETVRLYSDSEKGSPGTGIAWNDDGDTATLWDEEGRKVASMTY